MRLTGPHHRLLLPLLVVVVLGGCRLIRSRTCTVCPPRRPFRRHPHRSIQGKTGMLSVYISNTSMDFSLPALLCSSLHPIGSPLPGSYNGGPQASGFSPHPFGFPQPCPSSPTPAAAAAAAVSDGGGLSADSFFYETGHGGDGAEYDEEGYQPPSSSSAADPFAAAQTAWAMQGGNGGPSRG